MVRVENHLLYFWCCAIDLWGDISALSISMGLRWKPLHDCNLTVPHTISWWSNSIERLVVVRDSDIMLHYGRIINFRPKFFLAGCGWSQSTWCLGIWPKRSPNMRHWMETLCVEFHSVDFERFVKCIVFLESTSRDMIDSLCNVVPAIKATYDKPQRCSRGVWTHQS